MVNPTHIVDQLFLKRNTSLLKSEIIIFLTLTSMEFLLKWSMWWSMMTANHIQKELCYDYNHILTYRQNDEFGFVVTNQIFDRALWSRRSVKFVMVR